MGEHREQMNTQSATRDLNSSKNDNPCQFDGRLLHRRSRAFASSVHLRTTARFPDKSHAPQGVRKALLTPCPSTPGPGNPTLKLPPQTLGPSSEGDDPRPSRVVPSPWGVGVRGASRSPPHTSFQTPPSLGPPKIWDVNSSCRPGWIPDPPSRGFPHTPSRRGVLRAPQNPGQCRPRSSRVPLGGRGFTSTPARLDPRS